MRPKRVRITGELGAPLTLMSGPGQFEELGSGDRVLFLGLGPEPGALSELVPDARDVAYVECPEFAAQLSEQNPEAGKAPQAWQALSPEELTPERIRQSRVLFFRPNLKLFPSFWGPLLGKSRLALLRDRAEPPKEQSVVLPCRPGDLLIPELARAFERAGLTVRLLDLPPAAKIPGDQDKQLSALLDTLLAEAGPALYFSVNFKGLDPLGLAYHTLCRAGVRVAVWCVDNPWHLLSGLRAPFWRECALFVTDHSFLVPLAKHGAKDVRHLPLAVDPEIFSPISARGGPDHGLAERIVFVGRSAFPDKQAFFAGAELPRPLLEQARAFLDADPAARLDFAWWSGKLGLKSFWPDKQVRVAGLGAEEASLAHRASCLTALAKGKYADRLTVFGDQAWQDLLPPGLDLRPGQDYYRDLPAIYGQAKYSLNATSLLLPAGLTQRHFDVWAAGGFLVTDATPGLRLFPAELAGPVSFTAPGNLPVTLDFLERDPKLRKDLATAWRALILKEHTYARRAATILDALGLG